MATAALARAGSAEQLSPSTQATATARPLLLMLTLAAGLAGFYATSPALAAAAVAGAGPELTHLLRAMAGLKLLFAAGAIAATVWRLGAPVTWPRLAAYTLACAAMAAGPGLIWQMAHVKTGALLLHGGLLASVLLLWRDPGMAVRLAGTIAARRARLAVG